MKRMIAVLLVVVGGALMSIKASGQGMTPTPPAPVVVSGTVWAEADKLNSRYDVGDVPIEGVVIRWEWYANGFYHRGEVTTDSDGQYSIPAQATTQMWLVFPATNWAEDGALFGLTTSPGYSTEPLWDHGDNKDGPTEYTWVAGYGIDPSTSDFLFSDGHLSLDPGMGIGGYVWEDEDGDRTLDGTENGIPGVRVNLMYHIGADPAEWDGHRRNTVAEVTTTDSVGWYSFSGLPEAPAGQGAAYFVQVDRSEWLPGGTLHGMRMPSGAPDDPEDDVANDQNGGDALGEGVWLESPNVHLSLGDEPGGGSRPIGSPPGDWHGVLDLGVLSQIATPTPTPTAGPGSRPVRIRVIKEPKYVNGILDPHDDSEGIPGVEVDYEYQTAGGFRRVVAVADPDLGIIDVGNFAPPFRIRAKINTWMWSEGHRGAAGVNNGPLDCYESSPGSFVPHREDGDDGQERLGSDGGRQTRSIETVPGGIEMPPTGTALTVNLFLYRGDPTCDDSLGTPPDYGDDGVAVAGYVWDDENSDGVLGASEPGLAGVNIRAWIDSDGDGLASNGDSFIKEIKTDGYGWYEILGLPPGDGGPGSSSGREPRSALDYVLSIEPSDFASGGALEGYLPSIAVGAATDPDNDLADDNNGGSTGGAGVRVSSKAVSLTVGQEPGGIGRPISGNPGNEHGVLDIAMQVDATPTATPTPGAAGMWLSGRLWANKSGTPSPAFHDDCEDTRASYAAATNIILRVYADDGNGTFGAEDTYVGSTVTGTNGSWSFRVPATGRHWVVVPGKNWDDYARLRGMVAVTVEDFDYDDTGDAPDGPENDVCSAWELADASTIVAGAALVAPNIWPDGGSQVERDTRYMPNLGFVKVTATPTPGAAATSTSTPISTSALKTIGGTLWSESYDDPVEEGCEPGVFDRGEGACSDSPLEGVEVTVFDIWGGVAGTAVTDPSGIWKKSGLTLPEYWADISADEYSDPGSPVFGKVPVNIPWPPNPNNDTMWLNDIPREHDRYDPMVLSYGTEPDVAVDGDNRDGNLTFDMAVGFPSPTRTATSTPTATQTPTRTPVACPAGTCTPTVTLTPLATVTRIPTATRTPTPAAGTPTIAPVFEDLMSPLCGSVEYSSAFDHELPAYNSEAAYDPGNIYPSRRYEMVPYTGKVYLLDEAGLVPPPFPTPARWHAYNGHPGYDMTSSDWVGGSGPVFAVTDGVVTRAGYDGRVVRGCAGDGLYPTKPMILEFRESGGIRDKFVYQHLSTLSVQVGDSVSRGQLLGWTGSTGAPGEHLHFEEREFKNEESGLARDVFGWDRNWDGLGSDPISPSLDPWVVTQSLPSFRRMNPVYAPRKVCPTMCTGVSEDVDDADAIQHPLGSWEGAFSGAPDVRGLYGGVHLNPGSGRVEDSYIQWSASLPPGRYKVSACFDSLPWKMEYGRKPAQIAHYSLGRPGFGGEEVWASQGPHQLEDGCFTLGIHSYSGSPFARLYSDQWLRDGTVIDPSSCDTLIADVIRFEGVCGGWDGDGAEDAPTPTPPGGTGVPGGTKTPTPTPTITPTPTNTLTPTACPGPCPTNTPFGGGG